MRFRFQAAASVGSSRLHANEDAYGYGPTGVWVVDGASTLTTVPIEGQPPSAWYARALSLALGRECQVSTDAVSILHNALRAVALRYAERVSQSADVAPPSASAGIAVISEGNIQTAVLGDIAIGHVTTAQGARVHWIHTSMRSEAENAYEAQTAQAIADGASVDEARTDVMERIELRRRRSMNRPGGYWIASIDPAAAEHAVVRTSKVIRGDRILIASDGFMAADRYQVFPSSLENLATSQDLCNLIARIREVEASDPEFVAYPRVKASDDATAVIVEIR